MLEPLVVLDVLDGLREHHAANILVDSAQAISAVGSDEVDLR